MTAKRFELMFDDEVIIDNCSIADDGGKQIYWIVEYGQRVKVVELLNELHEENEYLRHQLISLDGLYVSDKEDMSDCWRLNLFSDEAK